MEQAAKPPEVAKPKSRNVILAIIIVVVLVVVGVGVYLIEFPPTKTTGPTIGDTVSIWDTSGACLQSASPPDCGFKDASTGNSTTIVSVGTTVQWTNNGGQSHTVTSCDPTDVSTYGTSACPNTDNPSSLASFNSGSISSGGKGSPITFNTAGTYYYFCYIHVWMHGEVIVR